ncbi:MAG TPA: nucleoside hydrolase [Armatimonadota bacterium]|nr:nucleoside hydrolase [Armatimonadota bacterium]
MANTAQRVIIDTDIGTDIDDAYALLLALASPELDIRGITLVHGNMDVRAGIALKLLKLAGREDIPVIPGESKPMNPERPIYWPGHEGKGLDFSDIELPAGDQSAMEFLASQANEDTVLIPIGPMTNVGMAIRDYPSEMARYKGIVAMASTFNGFGPENAGGEHNIALDPEAAEIVLNSGIPIVLAGLNVTLQTSLTRRMVEEISAAGTPLAEFMSLMTEDWFSLVGRDTTAMHDSTAVAICAEPDIFEMVPVRAEVDMARAGQISYYEADDSPVRICTSVDAGRFQKLFFSRILEAVG